MRQSTRPVPRRGAGRPSKRALESQATKSPERSAGFEPFSQGQTPHGTTGALGSRILTVLSLELPTPTVSTVPPVVPSATYSTPPPAVPSTTYLAPPPPVPATAYPAPATPVTLVPTTYSAPTPVVPVAPYLIPPSTIPPVAPVYIDPTMPPAVPAPTYAAAPGVPPPAYPAVPLVVPALMVPPITAAISTHPTNMVAARGRIPALAESMKSRFTLFREETDPSFVQGLDRHLQVKIADFGNSSYIEALDRTLMIEAAQQRANTDKKRKQIDWTSGQTQQPQATRQQ
ncbi:proline-rich protein 36-like [Zingiber officinale]|uniref:proline-rich protein 36-like n=1 Tax=Zingiber officinale TaxID=94328 RepID=UPI001C4B6847|nr:proline-rich protein 36-like [Zingiber officinale]